MEFLDEKIELLNSGKAQGAIDAIDDFLDKNPKYKTVDYYHIANPLEELLFDEYAEKIESVKVWDRMNRRRKSIRYIPQHI